MDKGEFRQKYLAELRSNKYKQIFGKLKGWEHNSFCAIGLAYEVFDPSRWGSGYHKNLYFAENNVADWLLVNNIIDYNDRLHLTFPEIANQLEAEWKVEV